MIHGWFIFDQNPIDEVLVCGFKAPNSFTGEDAIEIHCHGNPIIIETILEALHSYGTRLAEPGEFTQRAVLNGKLNLMQAESLADLISAESQQAHRLALNQYKGNVGHRLNELRNQLLDLAAMLELELDFSEENIEFARREELANLLTQIGQEAKMLRASFHAGQAIRSGIPVAIIGLPNAGKSSLLNALLNEERSIVSDLPGTTRDIIKERLLIDGFEFHFTDTAGLRSSFDPIEQEGIRRTWIEIKRAGVLLAVYDSSSDHGHELQSKLMPHSETESLNVIWIANKIDLLTPSRKEAIASNHLKVSTLTREGISTIVDRLRDHAVKLKSQFDLPISNARHQAALLRIEAAVQQALLTLNQGASIEVLSFELKAALNALGELTGQIDCDQVLSHIFSKFCIGK